MIDYQLPDILSARGLLIGNYVTAKRGAVSRTYIYSMVFRGENLADATEGMAGGILREGGVPEKETEEMWRA